MKTQLDDFTRGYIRAALWSSVDEDGVPLDSANASEVNRPALTISDFAPETLAKVIADCAKFQYEKRGDLADYCERYRPSQDYKPEECAGHDFWLTRNGHGAGFWDRGLGALGDRLTAAAKAFGTCDLYVGDDKKLYI